MYENVWEWRKDSFDENYHVDSLSVDSKGSYWNLESSRVVRRGYFKPHSRSVSHNMRSHNDRQCTLGLRLVKT